MYIYIVCGPSISCTVGTTCEGAILLRLPGHGERIYQNSPCSKLYIDIWIYIDTYVNKYTYILYKWYINLGLTRLLRLPRHGEKICQNSPRSKPIRCLICVAGLTQCA